MKEQKEVLYERNYEKENNEEYILIASIIFLIGVVLILFFGLGLHKAIKKFFSNQSENENGGGNENPV